ncbi:MAG: proline dehydrogenase family protein, partial [Henriciella sp.]|nr:proline dehydrogenase family protein [Henriciella sp.]
MADTMAPNYNWDALDLLKLTDEEAYLADLLTLAPLDASLRAAAVRRGRELVEIARSRGRKKGMMESFLEEFGLSNSEGLALMCLAEALLRVPDAGTRDDLITEKIRSGDWGAHKGLSDSWLVNASVWGLMLTGKVIGPPREAMSGPGKFVQGLVRASGEPVIRASMMQAMRIMGEQFVLGRTVKEALKRGQRMVKAGEAAHFSFDMLGEGARTKADAARYLDAYRRAISMVADVEDAAIAPENKSGISVKLSALHPRYEAVNEARVMAELYPVVLGLCVDAAKANINLCLDAEEADRLVISLKILEALMREPSLKGWTGLGLAVVRGIVINLQGEIHVQSELGQGTTMTLTMPVASPSQLPLHPQTPTASESNLAKLASSKSDNEGSQSKQPLILVAEDNQFVAEIVATTLEDANWRTILCVTGSEVSQKIKEHGNAIHLAVLDLDLPGVPGMQCLELLRQTHRDIPAVLISG